VDMPEDNEVKAFAKQFFSQRAGRGAASAGLPLHDVKDIFVRVFEQLDAEGYFAEALGQDCTDGPIVGKIPDLQTEILIQVGKADLWPISTRHGAYTEDDLFDFLEFCYEIVSKPTESWYHSWNSCGEHYIKFSKAEGKVHYRDRVNKILAHYEKKYELSGEGYIQSGVDAGLENLFVAPITAAKATTQDRINAATLKFRRHGASLDDRRHAVRDLADVLEELRPDIQQILTKADEKDLFRIANGFGIRHSNDKQQTNFDAAVWLSWMFYFYLATIYAVLAKLDKGSTSRL
jgi:hypothetical protein